MGLAGLAFFLRAFCTMAAPSSWHEVIEHTPPSWGSGMRTELRSQGPTIGIEPSVRTAASSAATCRFAARRARGLAGLRLWVARAFLAAGRLLPRAALRFLETFFLAVRLFLAMGLS